MPRQHIDDLLWRVYREAEELLRELERVETSATLANVADVAGRYISIITDHVEPLRAVIEAVEDHERASAEVEDRALAYRGPL